MAGSDSVGSAGAEPNRCERRPAGDRSDHAENNRASGTHSENSAHVTKLIECSRLWRNRIRLPLAARALARAHVERLGYPFAPYVRTHCCRVRHGFLMVPCMVPSSPRRVSQETVQRTSLKGRLTLRILLPFARFEREMIGERLAPRIAAQKRRGKWGRRRAPPGLRHRRSNACIPTKPGEWAAPRRRRAAR